MLVPTKDTLELDNGTIGHEQVIGFILCHFPNHTIIYPVGPVYYWPGHPFNAISSGALKFYASFQNVTSEPLEHYYIVDPQGYYWRSPYQTQNNVDYLKIEIVKVNPKRISNIVVPTVFDISKHNHFHIVHQHFGPCIGYQDKTNGQKRAHERYPKNLPDLEYPLPIFILTEANKITSGQTIGLSKISLA